MATARPSGTDNSEEARAFLQDRLGRFWKILFIFMLVATLLGIKGPLADPGLDLVLDVVHVVVTGVVWRLCRRRPLSIRALRILEAAGLVAVAATSAMLGRFVLVNFLRDQAVATAEGTVMADAYMTALGLIGSSLMMMIRAAIVPSSPRRTLLYTAIFIAPQLVVSILVIPSPDGFVLRAADSRAFPWMPVGFVMMWGFILFTTAMVSRTIFGLRREIREARQLGQYVLEEKIGEGGMGEVYRARHGLMRRPTALKLLRPDQSHAGSVARFEREVQQTARLTHPNTITIFDYGRTDDGVFYYAMELLDGANLQRIVSVTGPQSPERVVRILAMACGALAEAHGMGLIHRDIKPANIILCTQGGERDVVKLLDFGLVKEMKVDEDVKLTGATMLTGSPQYMAPEAIRAADRVDARTDIYALGAVAYFLLAGSELFDGKSIIEVCSQHLSQPPAPLATRGVTVPAELEALVMACLEKDPDRRPQTALELRKRLEALGLEAWTADHATAWWEAHQSAFEQAPDRSDAGPRTIMIDGAPR